VKQQATTIAPPSTLASGGEGPSAKEGGGGGGDRNSLMRGGSGPGPQGSGGAILGQEPEEESVVNTIRLYARGAGTSMSPALAGRLSLAKGRSVRLGFECLNEEGREGGREEAGGRSVANVQREGKGACVSGVSCGVLRWDVVLWLCSGSSEEEPPSEKEETRKRGAWRSLLKGTPTSMQNASVIMQNSSSQSSHDTALSSPPSLLTPVRVLFCVNADFHGSQDGSSAASSVVVGGEGGGTGSIRVPPPASVEDDDPFAEMDDSDHSPPKGPPKAPLLKLPLVRPIWTIRRRGPDHVSHVSASTGRRTESRQRALTHFPLCVCLSLCCVVLDGPACPPVPPVGHQVGTGTHLRRRVRRPGRPQI
jgi:hypothetical protein